MSKHQEFEKWYAKTFLAHIPEHHKPNYFRLIDDIEYINIHVSGAYAGFLSRTNNQAIHTDNSAVIAALQEKINGLVADNVSLNVEVVELERKLEKYESGAQSKSVLKRHAVQLEKD